MLNHLLLIVCICIVIAIVLYLFYWNRLLAHVLSFAIRIAYWNRGSSSIWIEIGAIHFSLLAGRILVKDICYHSSNQTIKIVKGQIEWRYWIRRPTTEVDISFSSSVDEAKPARRSCRIQITLQGYQWFLYNRTAAFDSIIQHMQRNTLNCSALCATENRDSVRKGFMSHGRDTLVPIYPPSILAGTLKTPTFIKKALTWANRQLPNLDPKDLLPFGLEITEGAIICGNASTPNLLLAEFKHVEGTFGIVQSRSKYDLYKQVLDLQFNQASMRFVQNNDYRSPMTAAGDMVQTRIKQYSHHDPPFYYMAYSAFAKLWKQLQFYSLTSRIPDNSTHPVYVNQHGHQKNEKSLDDLTPIGPESHELEYAIERKLFEAPILELSYYADVVGEVPPSSAQVEPTGVEPIDIGNGGLPPQWGIDIIVRGGSLRYGPWADRQRVELQRAFFPSAYHDFLPTPHLKPGDQRLWTNMRVFVELLDDTTLHIPFREISKDWEWDGLSDVPQRPRRREPAWVHVTVGDRSSINYTIPMVAGSNGYDPLLEVHLDTMELTSSLNDIRLVKAESCRVHSELPTPLEWRAQRKWVFGITLRQPVLYLIRDHINLFTDLVRDWTSGPPHDYFRFIPMIYLITLEMHHYELNMYANDQNIIDKPLIKEDNVLFTLRGARFKNEVQIPSNTFRPDTTAVPFFFELPDVSVNLSLPRWNTNALHASKDGNNIGYVGSLRIDASYRYYADVREENMEQLKLTFFARDVVYKTVGWSIRYFMILRENYFGSFTHFSTLFEYLDKRQKGIKVGDPIEERYRPGKANPLQIEMNISIENATMVAPAGLPGYEVSPLTQAMDEQDAGIGTCVLFNFTMLQVYLRVHEHYMELSLNSDPISGHIQSDFPEIVTRAQRYSKQKETIFIDGIDIVANRLFGPQPRAATYLCLWEVHVGKVNANLSAWEGRVFAAAMTSFRLNYVDPPNAPAAEYMPEADPDITFLKFTVDAVNIIWQGGSTAIELAISRGLKMDTNDKAGEFHRKVTSCQLPHLSLKIFHTMPSARSSWLEAAEFTADGDLDIYSAPYGWQDMASKQQAFVQFQDAPTSRVKRMLDAMEMHMASRRATHRNGVFLPQPALSTVSVPPVPSIYGLPRSPTRMASGQRVWQKLFNLSESEDEDGISEADRDARLAKSRTHTPPTFTPVSDEDQTMSSGDESDNEDLTAESSDSDWPDRDDHHGPNIHSLPSLRLYSLVTRHYMSRVLDSPVSWDGSPFFVVRDYLPIISTRPVRQDHSSRFSGPLLDQSQEERDLTILRVRCQKGIEVRITPLIIPVLASLEEQAELNPLGPELHIDSILSSCLDSVPNSTRRKRSVILDVDIASARVLIFQHIYVAHEKLTKDVSSEKDNRFGTMVMLETVFGGGRFRGKVAGRNFRAQLSLDSLIISLRTAADKRKYRSADSTETLSITIMDVTAMAECNAVETSWNLFSARVDHQGPEYIIAFAIAIYPHITRSIDIWRRWNTHSSTITQYVLRDIIRSSNELPIVDYLSTIQPSYLVQSGIPQEIRNASTVRFLFHLRSCLSGLDKRQRLAFRSLGRDISPVPMRDILTLLESRYISLALDVDNPAVIYQTVLEETLFPGRRRRPLRWMNTVVSFTIQLQHTTLLILDPFGSSASEIAVAPTRITACTRTYDFLPSSLYSGELPQLHQGVAELRILSLLIQAESVVVAVTPHLMVFAQQLLRIQRQHQLIIPVPSQSVAKSKVVDQPDRGISSFEITVSVESLRVRAAAQNLVVEFGLSNVQTFSSTLSSSSSVPSAHTFISQHVILEARAPTDQSKPNDQDVLASLILENVKSNVTISSESHNPHAIRSAFAIGAIVISVPRSALKLYRFIEEWRADYLPGIEGMLQALLLELKNSHPKPSSTPSTHPTHHHVYGKVQSVLISLQVMHGTWLSWAVTDTFAYLQPPDVSKRDSTQNFGLQLTAQVFNVSSRSLTSIETIPNTRVKVEIPQISIAGVLENSTVHTLTLIEHFQAIVKPSHWDTLLAVQQKFGRDFNDLVALVQETQRKRSAASKPVQKRRTLAYNGFFMMRGFDVGLQGISSTLVFECANIRGGVDEREGSAWHAGLSGLALSLSPRAISKQFLTPGTIHRSAFVNVDLEARARSQFRHGADTSCGKLLKIDVPKIHAVMQPSSVGEIGDFIDHLQAEMLERQEQRAQELEAFKEKTKHILRTFDVSMPDRDTKSISSWINQYILEASIRNVGVAFPLTLDQDLGIPQSSPSAQSAVKAFLFSIKSIDFSTQRGETGQAKMKGFSFQFVPRFRQTEFTSFLGENHQTRNRLLYPEMTAQLRTEGLVTSRKVRIAANVSGFILDLDSTISEYVFSLIDVYRQGKARVAQLSASLPRTPSTIDQPHFEDIDAMHRRYTALPTSNILAALTFLSGKVRAHSGPASNLARSHSFSHIVSSSSDDQLMNSDTEVLSLPVVSVWAEYRATPAAHKLGTDQEVESSMLLFESTIHSSENTLQPTLLPFVTDLISHVETRMRKVSRQTSHHPENLVPHSASATTATPTHEPVSSMQISFCLRIDRSKLGLTCQPDVNVIAGLHWNSGGFVVNVSPGARTVTFTGSVSGLTIGLKHGFLSEDCVRLDARNLAFTVNFAKLKDHSSSISSISVVMDTEISGAVHLSRLQDVLCFKAVWLDHIPILTSQKSTVSQTSAKPSVLDQEFTTAILVRFRYIQLGVDLGHSISTISLDLRNALLRTRMVESFHEVSISVAEVVMSARGNLSGAAKVPNCVFQTIRRRRSEHLTPGGDKRMLELRMTSGTLTAMLESEHQPLLYYSAEPLEVEVYDDWSSLMDQPLSQNTPLGLSFVVSCAELVAAVTVGTIPKLLVYSNKFKANLQAQRDGASRESKTFRITRNPKPDNPLSAVANAILSSARNRFKKAESELVYVIHQYMDLRLDLLRLVVFPRTMSDTEIAHFIAYTVQAKLDRRVDSEVLPAIRDLCLSFKSMTISRFSQLQPLSITNAPRPDIRHQDGRVWLTSLLKNASEAIIVGMPAMKMRMKSEEQEEDDVKLLIYDFDSKFIRGETKDIYITLNVSLYSWLTVLRRNLSREMEQVQATEDWRTVAPLTSPAMLSSRKKALEPTGTADAPSSSPSEHNFHLDSAKASAESPTSLPSTPPGHSPTSLVSEGANQAPASVQFPQTDSMTGGDAISTTPLPHHTSLLYRPRFRDIERLTMRQLGEATPDVMHPFFTKRSGFNLEDALPQYVNEYATTPLEEIMEVLLQLYSRQLLAGNQSWRDPHQH